MKSSEQRSSKLVVSTTLIIACLSVIALCGCGGGSDSGHQQQPPPPLTPTPEFIYTANGRSDDVSGFAGDASTGALLLVSGSPFAAGDVNENVPGVLTADAAGKFVFGTVRLFAIDSNTGVLTHVSDTAAGNQPFSVAVGGAGKFLYVANAGSNSGLGIAVFDRHHAASGGGGQPPIISESEEGPCLSSSAQVLSSDVAFWS